jgi:hypothetical protein
MDAAYRFRHDKASLGQRGVEGVVRAAFMFSLPTLIHSIGEMALGAAGFNRRIGVDTTDVQGDEIGNNAVNAKPYRAFISSTGFQYPTASSVLTNSDGSQSAIAGFLDWCRSHGVIAVGGLPTVFDDQPIDASVVRKLKSFYASHGAEFLALNNLSQYPRSAFFDAEYHLQQEAQIQHSYLVADGLAQLNRQRQGAHGGH